MITRPAHVWLLLLLLAALALIELAAGCSSAHVRAAPAVDAGPAQVRCLEWRLRANPEDVYCAAWATFDQ